MAAKEPVDYPVTPDGRYFVVRGRLWRRTNPNLPEEKRSRLVKDLMAARRIRDREGVDRAKRALGERGPTWWNGPDFNRYLAKNTPYAEWYSSLKIASSSATKRGAGSKRKSKR